MKCKSIIVIPIILGLLSIGIGIATSSHGHYNQTIANTNKNLVHIPVSSSIDYNKIPMYVYVSGLGLDQYCKGNICEYPDYGDHVIQLTVTDVNNKPWKKVPVTVGFYTCGDSDFTSCGETYQTGYTDSNGQIRFAWEHGLDEIEYISETNFDIYATSPKSGRQVYVFKNFGTGLGILG